MCPTGRTGGDQLVAVERIRSHGAGDNAGTGDHLTQRVNVGRICDDQWQFCSRLTEAVAHARQRVGIAPGETPSNRLTDTVCTGEVRADEATGEAGCTPDDDIKFTLHCRSVRAGGSRTLS